MELTFGSRDLNDQTSINPNEIAKGMVLEERTRDDDEDRYGGGKDNDDDIYIMMQCLFVCNEKWSLCPTEPSRTFQNLLEPSGTF